MESNFPITEYITCHQKVKNLFLMGFLIMKNVARQNKREKPNSRDLLRFVIDASIMYGYGYCLMQDSS